MSTTTSSLPATKFRWGSKKNRQRVILEVYKAMKGADAASLTPPNFLLESKASSGIETGRKRLDALVKRLKGRLTKVLQQPTTSNPLYKVA